MADQNDDGWRPDPTGRHQLRYFSTGSWTDDVSDDGAVSVDPFGDRGAGRAVDAPPVDEAATRRRRRRRPVVGCTIIAFGCIALGVSVFLPWEDYTYIDVAQRTYSLWSLAVAPPFELVGIAIVVFLCSLLMLLLRRRWLAAVALLGGGLAVAIAASMIPFINDKRDVVDLVSKASIIERPTIGLWVAIGGALAMVVGGLAALFGA